MYYIFWTIVTIVVLYTIDWEIARILDEIQGMIHEQTKDGR